MVPAAFECRDAMPQPCVDRAAWFPPAARFHLTGIKADGGEMPPTLTKVRRGNAAAHEQRSKRYTADCLLYTI